MKILHIINSLDCGGLEKFAIDLSVELNRRGHTSQIACLTEGGELGDLAKKRKLTVTTFHKEEGFDFNLLMQLSKFIRVNKFDIVHTHNMAPLIYGTLAARLAFNPRIINTRHGREAKTAHPLIWALNRKVVAISHDAAERMLKVNRVNKSKVSVIHNGTDVKAFDIHMTEEEKQAVKIELGLKNDTLILGNIGRLVKEKDQASLIKALRKMISKKIKVELVIVGDGALKEELLKLIKELNCSDSVKITGFREDVPRVLQIMDVFILSSFTEGVSLTLLEAMAAGKPVIATKVGGNPEVVEDGKTGILVPCGFPERIESAVMKFYANRSIIPQFGDAGRNRAYTFFTLDRMTTGYEKLYKEMLG